MAVIAQQKKPDFSGEWTLNVQASTLSPTVASVAQSGVLRIEHHEPSLKCQMTIVLDGRPFESKFEMLSDGLEVTATDGGRRIVSSLPFKLRPQTSHIVDVRNRDRHHLLTL